MTTAEKAHAYNEALARANELYNRGYTSIPVDIFPELKEENEESFEIPFGAYDSELVEETYFIPEGMEAVIEGDKVIIRRKESEDEKIRKAIINAIHDYAYRLEEKIPTEWLTWLEKQGEERKITHEEICKSYGIPDIGEFSDGYHTFNGLYKQRMILFAVLVKTYKDRAWKSWKHEDGLDCFGGGWFIVGIDTPAGTYTYHYEAKDWDRFDCQILEKAKHWDGHDEFDVERLFSLVSNANKDEVIRCLINGMKFYYENNKEATWGTDKWSMPVKHIIEVLEKQGEQKPAEPRFRFSIGDEIKSENEEPLTITKIDDKGYWSNDLFICGFEDSYKWELIGKLIDTPVWSEEDENMLNNCIAAIVHPDCFSYSFMDEAEVWLKSLKGRMQKGK